MRESVVMYVSTYSAILKRISSVEQREAIFESIFDYAFYDEPIQEFGNPVADAIMDMVKPLIDNNNKNYVNGCKGGRPKKNETDDKKPPDKTTGKNHRIKPSEEPPGEGNVNVDKNVNENVNVDSHLHFTKEGDAPPPSAGAGGAHTFTFTDVQQCVEENDIDLSDKGITAFYKWMEKYNWKINNRKVTKLENALSGYAKKHPEYSLDQEEPEEPKSIPQQYLKTFKAWLRYHDYADGGMGDFSKEISISDEILDVVFEVESQKESMENINNRLMDKGFRKDDIKPLMMLFNKWVKEKNKC